MDNIDIDKIQGSEELESYEVKKISEDISTPPPNKNQRAYRVQHILNFIKENPGTTAYEISKKLIYSYSDVCRIIRDLEYTSIIIVKTEYFESIVRKKLYIPEIKEGDKND